MYAAGLAVAQGAASVDYADRSQIRRQIAESLGARALAPPAGRRARRLRPPGGYDVVVEASSTATGLRQAIRALAPGGTCTGVGYYTGTVTGVPVMRMYATSATLRVGVSHARAVSPDLLDFVARTGFPAEDVTTLTADWDDAPAAYATHTTKLVLERDPIVLPPDRASPAS